jgi:hypothetical protein
MGLDMYVNIRHKDTQSKLEAYKAWENKYSYEEFQRLTEEQKEEYRNSEPEYDEEMYGKELMYWRKANQIHNWFVQNCQNGVDDCEQYPITVADLKKLKALCEKILTMTEVKQELRPTYPNGWFSEPVHVMKDVRLLTEEGVKFASEHLPSRSGFFFGGTEYDDDYVLDLENTIEQITDTLDTLNCEYGFALNTDLVTGEYKGDYIIEYMSSW